MGIRRISMGVQTTDFKQAKTIGREDANASTDYLYKAVESILLLSLMFIVIWLPKDIRNAGFQSYNIDLMYGFPVPKSGSAFAQTVRDAINLQPVYSMSITCACTYS